MLYQRIKEVRKCLNLSQKEFGSRLGVSRDVVANIEYRRVKPTKIFLQQLCMVFHVNRNWLESGEGEMFLDKNEILPEAMRIFESLNPDLQQYALNQIKALLELQKKQKNGLMNIVGK